MYREHKEFLRDLIQLIINVSPISWIVSITHFTHKWAYKKKGVRRVARHVRNRRRNVFRMSELDEYMKRY